MDNQNLFESTYNPDVLSCIANLSNDEVFTPPEIANKMLDMLPQELFKSSKTKFLDPACKSGVFLREIAKRLLVGLQDEIPDLQERINHIFKNQVFGIAITELTSLLSRRSVYCSKYPNCKYSVCQFDENDAQGNIYFSNIKHQWINGKCLHCGASQKEYSDEKRENLESHAYQFIHKEGLGKLENMKFDVIIGNPPYQMNDGGGTGSSASAIYQYFVSQGKKLNPRYLVMIIPSRWMTGGKGLDSFRKEMIMDRHIKKMVDFLNPEDCFPGVKIEAGVCYFLWDKEYNGKCEYTLHNANKELSKIEKYLDEEGQSDIVIREPNIISILNKIKLLREQSFSTLVSTRNAFKTENLDSIISLEKTERRIFMREKNERVFKYIKSDYLFSKNIGLSKKYKLFISKADGAAGQIGNPIPARILGKVEFGYPNDICSETFLCIGPFETEKELKNVKSYIYTKFFRCIVGIRKNKNMTSDTYQFVPIQDFSKPWTDEELYKKYNLTQEEIDFIESMIRPMS